MRLVNHTPFPAELFRTIIDERRFAASILVRVTYDLTDLGLVVSAEQPWIVSAAPWEGPRGLMDGDEIFYKGGVDLFVFGHARPDRGREVTQMEVAVALGDFRRSVRIFGDRIWQRRGSNLVPSQPVPFQEMPLSLDRAFGGKCEWDGLDVAYPFNPDGKGFYLEEEQAVGQPLPNMEEPEQQIGKWDDRPEPAGLGLCPLQSPSRVRNGCTFDDNGKLLELKGSFFNAAFPTMIVPTVRPGDRFHINGVCERGPLTFKVPPTEFVTRLQFDSEVIERTLAIDQVGFDADRNRVFVAYRYPFRYVLHPMQRRSCELRVHGLAGGGIK